MGLSGDLCNLFRFIKRKNMFMKTDMMRDIHAMRFNVKKIDNQGESNCSKKTHKENTENPIYDYYRDAKKENIDNQRYVKNYNQETVETNNQKGIDYQEQE